MKTSYNWLKKYVDLTDITPELLADKLTNAGLEVEGISRLAYGTNLIVGHVLECVDHPDSDHLHLCQVDTGKETLQIICGAANVAKDQKVIVAQVGSKLPEITIKAGNIRGEKSQGMICSLFELGVDKKNLSEQELSGITVLPDNAKIGDPNPLAYIGLDDVLIDISLTPNRADCLALFSLAYEVGAIFDRNVTLPEYESKSDIGKSGDLKIISHTDNCSRFIGKIINKLVIKQSPQWMKDALLSVGIKSINNVVDISNYVMLETGQPLHFYDLAKMPAKEIVVRDDLETVYTALDGQAYQILKGDLMITSNDQAIGIAGIMGGDDSKIDEKTTSIIIEAAIFDLATIRNSSRRLNLTTEASLRFQKGIDPLAPKKAVDRAVALLIELAEAEQIEQSVILGDFSDDPYQITISASFINHYLSTSFTMKEIIDVFGRLQLNPTYVEDDITVKIPSYRTDLRLPVDLTEEVIRLLGYENVPSTLPKIYQVSGEYALNARTRYQIKDILKDQGFFEVINYSLVANKHLQDSVLAIEKPVSLSNPLSEDKKYYRTSILPSVLETIAYNRARYLNEYMLFEIGNVYSDDNVEKEHLALVISSQTTINRWKHLKRANDFYTLKGVVIKLVEKLGFDPKRVTFNENDLDHNMFNPYQSALVYIDRTLIAIVGSIHPLKQKQWDIDRSIIAEVDLSAIYSSNTSKVKFQPIPRFPGVNYDLALIVDDSIKANDMCIAIKKTGGKLVKDVIVFDVYQGTHVEKGKKSLAFSITYQSLDKTLNDQDVQAIQQEIIKMLKKQYQAVLRES